MYTQWWSPFLIGKYRITEYDHRTRHWCTNINYTAKPTSGATRVAENKVRRKHWGKRVHCKMNIWFLSMSKNSVCWQKKLCSFFNRYHDSVIFFRLYLFISQRLQNKLCNLYQSFSLTLISAFVWSSCGRKPEYPKQAYLSWWPHDHHTCRRVFVNVNVCICHLL